MTLEELYSNLEAAGFTRHMEAPEPEQEPEPSQQPQNAASNDALLEAIKGLTAALQANAVRTVTFDNPPKEASAEDILGAMLAGKKPDN